MPELKRVPQEGKMNLDFHERIVPPGQYREALNVGIGRSETSEVGTVENILGNAIAHVGGTIPANSVCIGSYRDNGNERIYFFTTNNNSYNQANVGDHRVFEFDQVSRRLRTLVSDTSLNFHQDFLITGINLLEDLLLWTDDRNEPRKINVTRARNDSAYYNSDVLMSIAKTAPFEAATISNASNDAGISSTFLQDKLPRFSYRWQFEDGEYSVLAPFTPIIFQPPANANVEIRQRVNTGEVSDFVNNINSISLVTPIVNNAGIVSVELIYKDTNSSTLYIVEDKSVPPGETEITFDYLSQDPFRTLPPSQLTRVSDAVPRRAKSQEVAGGRVVYGNYLQNYNLPPVGFEIADRATAHVVNRGTTNHAVKTRRTYQIGIVLSDRFGRTTPVILSNTGGDTRFLPNTSINRQLTIAFEDVTQLEDFHSYKVVVKQREQEYYNWFTSTSGVRNGDSVNKVPIDVTIAVDSGATMRPSSRRVYAGDVLASVTINNSDGNAQVGGVSPTETIYEVEPVISELDIFFETSTGGLVSDLTNNTAIPIDFYNCYVTDLFGGSLEVNRIRMGFNEPAFDVGVRAHIVNEDFAGEERRFNTLIHSSGLFNSRTGINQLNQFNEAEGGLTINLDPSDGSIQKLYAEDTQLLIFQEDKISRSPIDKDFIYSAEGGAIPVTSNTQYLGTVAPYPGEYGISRDPGSFAVYGTTKYFTDRNRGVVLRLEQGLQEISRAGLSDFFRDALQTATSVIGSYDEYHNQYNLTIRGDGYPRNEDTNKATASDDYFTISFEEDVVGWVSFKSFRQESGTTLNNRYYTFFNGDIWEHNRDDVQRNNFYNLGVQPSYVDFIFNDAPSAVKEFKTVGYEGTTGWQCEYIDTDIQNVGDVPTPSTNFADVRLSVSIAQNQAGNIAFAGDSTQIVELTGDPATGEARWILVVSPINNQYEFTDATNVQLAGVPAIKSLVGGNIYFDIRHNVTADDTLNVTLSGAGADLAFTVTFLTINVQNSITNTIIPNFSRRFVNRGTNEVQLVPIIANEGFYLDIPTTSVTIDDSDIRVPTDFRQSGQTTVVANSIGDFTNATLTLPISTPNEPSGVHEVILTGMALPLPTITWSEDTMGLVGYDTTFTQVFDRAIGVSPRDTANSARGEQTYTMTITDLTTQIFDTDPSVTVENATISTPIVLDEVMGNAVVGVTSNTLTTTNVEPAITAVGTVQMASLGEYVSGTTSATPARELALSGVGLQNVPVTVVLTGNGDIELLDSDGNPATMLDVDANTSIRYRINAGAVAGDHVFTITPQWTRLTGIPAITPTITLT